MSVLHELCVAAMANGLSPEQYVEEQVAWINRESAELSPLAGEMMRLSEEFADVGIVQQGRLLVFMKRWTKLTEEVTFVSRCAAELEFLNDEGVESLVEGAL